MSSKKLMILINKYVNKLIKCVLFCWNKVDYCVIVVVRVLWKLKLQSVDDNFGNMVLSIFDDEFF